MLGYYHSGDCGYRPAEDTSLLKDRAGMPLGIQMTAYLRSFAGYYVTPYDGSLSKSHSAGRGIYVLH